MGTVEQALFGYRNGHQLLASSMTLTSATSRRLGSLTDMSFGGKAEHYLTAFPVTELKRFALVRTWPAPESSRRGSVWSHVLLIDLVALAEFDNLSALTTLFRRPVADAPDSLESYRHEVMLPDSLWNATTAEWSLRDAEGVLWGAYGQDGSGIVVSDDPVQAEYLLLAVWQQEWPRLRRNFSFRTRYRVSSGPSPFSVQVVERLERDQVPVHPPSSRPAWLVSLSNDLRRPDAELRRFLRAYGTESSDGRRDLPKLVQLAGEIGQADEQAVIEAVASAFPTPTTMPALKAALLGRAEENWELWRLPESRRLELMLLMADAQRAFDLAKLDSRARVADLWKDDRREARHLLELIEFSSDENAALRGEVLSVAMSLAAPEDLAAVSETNPEVAITLLDERREFLAEPALWVGDPALVDRLLDLLDAADDQTRDEVLRRLLAAEAAAPAARLLGRAPSMWWRALELLSASATSGASQRATLGSLLDAVGPGAIGAVPPRLTPEALELLATAVSPLLGLWRQVPPETWLSTVQGRQFSGDHHPSPRLLVVLVSAAEMASKSETRRKLWCQSFAPLHRALLRHEVQGDDLVALGATLPCPSAIQRQDYAGRLRAALAIEIRRSSWPREEIDQIVMAAAPYEDALASALAAGKKKKSWLRGLADQLLP